MADLQRRSLSGLWPAASSSKVAFRVTSWAIEVASFLVASCLAASYLVAVGGTYLAWVVLEGASFLAAYQAAYLAASCLAASFLVTFLVAFLVAFQATSCRVASCLVASYRVASCLVASCLVASCLVELQPVHEQQQPRSASIQL